MTSTNEQEYRKNGNDRPNRIIPSPARGVPSRTLRFYVKNPRQTPKKILKNPPKSHSPIDFYNNLCYNGKIYPSYPPTK